MSGRTYNLLLRRLGLTLERDTQCGMKGFTADAAEAIFSPLSTPGFGFDVEAMARAERGGWRVAALPVTWSHVEASRVRALRDGAAMGISALVIRRRLKREEAASAGPKGTMAPDAIDVMARVERDHWWFRAKRSLVADVAASHGAEGRWIDVGCGSGALVREQGHERPTFGVELDRGALALASEAVGGRPLARGAAEEVPMRTGSAAVVTALDVVEHLDDDVAALRELGRVASGGLVVVVVPAYMWAWSDHDVHLGHRRRYTRRSLREAAVAADLDVLRVTHFHSWLVPPAALLRRTPLRRLVRGSTEEASFVSPAVNRTLVQLTRLERWLLRRVDLPVGLSILLVAVPRSGEAPR